MSRRELAGGDAVDGGRCLSPSSFMTDALAELLFDLLDGAGEGRIAGCVRTLGLSTSLRGIADASLEFLARPFRGTLAMRNSFFAGYVCQPASGLRCRTQGLKSLGFSSRETRAVAWGGLCICGRIRFFAAHPQLNSTQATQRPCSVFVRVNIVEQKVDCKRDCRFFFAGKKPRQRERGN